MRRYVLGFFSAISVLAVLVYGCGTEAVGIETCRKIEEARCQRAESCQISLDHPVRRDDLPRESCIRYYNDACLHGLSGADPGSVQAQACVDAIAGGTCDVVKAPELSPACSFLIPAGTPATDASVADVAVPATEDAASTVTFPFDASVIFP